MNEILKFPYKDANWTEVIRQVAFAANRLGIERQQINEVKILQAFGEGIEIKFETVQHFEVLG